MIDMKSIEIEKDNKIIEKGYVDDDGYHFY